MSLIFITGMSGTGKSTVKEELTRRGYLAYDTDDDGLSVWINIKTGKPAGPKPSVQFGTPEWHDTYFWTLQADKVREQVKRTSGEFVFMCGIPGNWREVIPMFDMVFCLVLDNESLKWRLLNRTNNDYGKDPRQLRDLMEWNKSMAAESERLGATIIEADRPVKEIVNTILKSLE